jgi:hypothetical protein
MGMSARMRASTIDSLEVSQDSSVKALCAQNKDVKGWLSATGDLPDYYLTLSL